MTGFEYARPTSLAEVFSLLTEFGERALPLAGGTDAIVRMKAGRLAPGILIDLKRVPELSAEVAVDGSSVGIGAKATLSAILTNPAVREVFPALSEALATIGSEQIRNRATLAGNICNASPAADSAPPLLVYQAKVHLAGPGSNRVVPIAGFFAEPGKSVLQRGEIVTEIELPIPCEPTGAAFARLTRRRGVDLATLSVACLVTASGAARVALGAVAPTPLLVPVDCGALAAPAGAPEEWEPVIARIAAHARPISDVRASREYRMAMLPVLIRRALLQARVRLHGEGGSAR